MKVIYLCGPIKDRTDAQCKAWREEFKAKWYGVCLDPLRRDYRGREHKDRAQLVEDDLNDINKADALVVYYDSPSIGTTMELFYAKRILRKRTVLLNVSGKQPEELSAWLIHHIDGIANTVDGAIALLNEP